MKDANADLHKSLDVVEIEYDRLSGELTSVRSEQEVALDKALHLEVSYDTQLQYIIHLPLILGPHIDKLPEELPAKIMSIPGVTLLLSLSQLIAILRR